MSIQNAGAIIREVRIKAGLTQEQLSEGICETTSLSCIERGVSGVSPSTFRALMDKTGFCMEIFPTFVNRADFDCFYTLKHARFYLDGWFLNEANTELEKVYEMNCSDNRFYYQEFLLLSCRLQLRSGHSDYNAISLCVMKALCLSIANFNPEHISFKLLSANEIELLICLAYTYFYTGQQVKAYTLCQEIKMYLSKTKYSFSQRTYLMAENAIIYINLLFASGDYIQALDVADEFRKLMIRESDDTFLHELTFLSSIANYHIGDTEKALQLFKMVFYSAYSVKSCYATLSRRFFLSHTTLEMPKEILSLPDITIVTFSLNEIISDSWNNGIWDLSSMQYYQLGNLIHDLRIEQSLTQIVLCQGLCTKSMLSKIEHNLLMPNASLAEALLQRLGITDTVFTFFSNEKEAKLYQLKKVLFQNQNRNKQFVAETLKEMNNILQTNNFPLYQQYYLFKKATYEQEPAKHIAELKQALDITLPNFNLPNILNYRLSWNELTILNNLAEAYAQSGSYSQSIHYLYMILSYLKQNQIDILYNTRIYAVTANLLTAKLYHVKQYEELESLTDSLFTTGLKHSLRFTGCTYANCCQSFGEQHKNDKALLYAKYAYHTLILINAKTLAEKIKKYMADDFQLNID